jgi:hypothetical protein
LLGDFLGEVMSIKTTLWLLVFCIGSRLIPHLPNASPLSAMALLVGAHYRFREGVAIIFIGTFLSDIALAGLYGYPIIGTWSLFTYSGLLFFIIAGHYANYLTKMLVLLLSSTLGFWLWTNIGVWLFSTMYTKDISGLLACFTAAIPFLQTAIMANGLWLIALVLGLAKYQQCALREQV